MHLYAIGLLGKRRLDWFSGTVRNLVFDATVMKHEAHHTAAIEKDLLGELLAGRAPDLSGKDGQTRSLCGVVRGHWTNFL